MATICPYCNIEVSESAIEADDIFERGEFDDEVFDDEDLDEEFDEEFDDEEEEEF